MVKEGFHDLKEDIAMVKEGFHDLKEDIAILKYRVTYNCWEKTQKQSGSPKKKPMSQRAKDLFMKSCTDRCQITGKKYDASELNRNEAAISHICPISADFLLKRFTSVHDFQNIAFFNKKLETAFDDQRLRFIKSPNKEFLILDIVDLKLKDEVFDEDKNIIFGDLQGLPLDIRFHRPSFTAFSQHAISAAIHAEKMGWNDNPDIVSWTYKKGMFHTSPEKEQVEKIQRILWEMEKDEIGEKTIHLRAFDL